MKRAIFWFVWVALLAALAASVAWVMTTEAGLRWAYARLQAYAPDRVAVESLEGTLAGPLVVRGLRYRSEATTAEVGYARLDWSPAALLIGRLQVDTLVLERGRVRLARAQAPAPRARPDIAFPLNLRVDALRIRDLAIERPNAPRYTLHTLALSGFVGQQVARIDRLQLEADYVALEAAGTLGLASSTEQGLRVSWRVAWPEQPVVAGSGTVTGHISDLRFEQTIVEPIAANVRGRLRAFEDAPLWDVNAQIPAFDPSRLGLDLGSRRAQLQVSIEASGAGGRFEVEAGADIRAEELPPLDASLRVHGQAGGEVTLERLLLRVADSDMQLQAEARWQPEGEAWRARLQWRELRWPFAGDVRVASSLGSLEAEGTLGRYEFKLDAATTGPDLPPAKWRARGNGDRTHIDANDVVIETMGGRLNGAARLAWSPHLRWQAHLDGRNLDPATRWPEWPGDLSLVAAAQGDVERMRVAIEQLEGTLRGHRLAATAAAERRGQTYPALSLALRYGGAAVNVSGAVGEAWHLDWRVDARDLGTLAPGAAGALRASGNVTGARAAPRLSARLNGTDLVYAGTRIEQASAEIALDLSEQTASRVEVRANGGRLLDRPYERVHVTAAGRIAAHTIDLDVHFPDPGLRAQLSGGYRDGTWRGTIDDSRLQLPDGAWRLAGRPTLALGARAGTLEQACWRAAEASLCLGGRYGEDSAGSFDVAANALPLALFRPLLADYLEVRGTVSGDARASVAAGRVTRADADFTFSPGVVAAAALGQAGFGYDGGVLRLAVDARGLRAEAQLDLPGADRAGATLSLPRWHEAAAFLAQPIEGRLTLRLRDLTPLDTLLLQIDDLRGELRADLALTGTPAAPRLRGEVVLADAAAAVPAAGIRLRDVRLTAAATGGEELRLDGGARSGDGVLGVSGRIVFPGDPAWRAELRLAGAEFLAADLREAQVYVSPDLRISAAPGRIHVSGDVRIPRATFALRQPPQGVVATSPDVVIVNAPEAPAPEQPWQVAAEVRVVLGDAVNFKGFGLGARIGGDLVLIDAPGQATTARGELRVAEGEYEAYGQKLRVERGRLLFVGGPVNNPGIDARAVRRIDATTTVGVELKGTLRSPQLTLFSDPAMPQADILSYLVFGRPLESTTSSEGRSLAAAARALQLAGGERLAQRIGSRFGIEEVEIETGSTPETAALVLGKRLSPRLYINYSIGLFEPENVLRLRYQLTPNWSLEAQSGTSSGGDLLYTIER